MAKAAPDPFFFLFTQGKRKEKKRLASVQTTRLLQRRARKVTSHFSSRNIRLSKRPQRGSLGLLAGIQGTTGLCNQAIIFAVMAEERPYQCYMPGCGYASNRSNSLVVHMRTHTQERPFACEVLGCGYTAATSGTLRTHMRIHTGERPFACEVLGCGYTASQSWTLRTHMRSHTGERFACDVVGCGYTASRRSTLNVHTQRKH